MKTSCGSPKCLPGLSILSAIGLVVSLCASALGTVQVTESFDNDPTPRGWSGVDNMTAPQNYGFSMGDVTGSAVNPPGGTATAGGEMGGTIARQSPPPANFYGVDLGGSIDISNEAFSVSGVVHLQEPDGGSGFYLGYSQGVASYGSGGDAVNFIGMQFDDSITGIAITFSSGGGRDRDTSAGVPDLVVGTTVPFSIDYDPNGNGGNGTLDMDINGVAYTWNMPGGVKDGLDPLTHFGIMPVSAGGADAIVWFDDLTYTAVNPIPEPSTLVLLAVGLVSMATLRLRRRCR